MTPEPKFLRRFDQIRAAIRRHQFRLGLATTVLAAATGFGLLAWADHRWELIRPARALGLGLVVAASMIVLVRWLVAPFRWWTRPRTAAEIEARFPELGQRIRTVVQYAGRPDDRIEQEGVLPSLVGALEGETERRATALPLDRVVRRGRVPALLALAAVPIALLAIAAARDPEWRVAIGRALLIERPYTTVVVRPGDVLVDQDASVPVVVEVKGRPRASVELRTRTAGVEGKPWKPQKLKPGRDTSSYERTIEKVKDPLEYRVVAGPAESATFEVRVRYPLAIRDFKAEVNAPAYTGLDPKRTQGGDVQGVAGSVATLAIAFDATPSEARLELTDPALRARAKPGVPPPGPTIVPLAGDGKAYKATLDLARSLEYRVVARTADGRVLPANKYRIDVREDRAPRVVFSEPDEALEVHTIAEVLHRIRVDDDFGIARAGIVYQFNDGDEKTLIARDFPVAPGQKPTAAATLEEVLLMETLGATPQDSVTYYAFAEDNHPGTPRRTETDLRYIDLRAFRREYKLAEPFSGDGDPLEFTTLGELIARQRINLNRANRLARRRPTDRAEADDPLKIAGFEEALLNLTREFTEGIEAFADARVDAMHKAIDAMQASVDALDRSRNAEAPPAMAEALKNLVAAKRELVRIIGENPALAARMRAFDRTQSQKIRRPRSKDQEAEELADRLEELAKEEDFVYATIAAQGESEPAPAPGGNTPGESDGDAKEPEKLDRRKVVEDQERIAADVRDLEEKLKQLEAASDLAKARLAKAAEQIEKASGALNRGNRKGAAEDAKVGAGMLHEVARQVKGEIAREAAEQLALARELAEELADRESDLADLLPPGGTGQGGNMPGKGKGEVSKPGQGNGGGPGSWGNLAPAEQVARMAEMAKTLEAWLARLEKGEDGRTADAIREILGRDGIGEFLEKAGRMGDLRASGKDEELGREAREQARRLEALAQALDQLHQGIVSPQLAALAEADRRVTELLGKLETLKSEAEVTAWRIEAADLLRELEKAGIDGLDALADALSAAGGGWHHDGSRHRWVASTPLVTALRSISARVKDRVQDLILKDIASARDEGTPPQFRELVDRYYEVLSQSQGVPAP